MWCPKPSLASLRGSYPLASATGLSLSHVTVLYASHPSGPPPTIPGLMGSHFDLPEHYVQYMIYPSRIGPYLHLCFLVHTVYCQSAPTGQQNVQYTVRQTQRTASGRHTAERLSRTEKHVFVIVILKKYMHGSYWTKTTSDTYISVHACVHGLNML